jgi:hypothetical protein
MDGVSGIASGLDWMAAYLSLRYRGFEPRRLAGKNCRSDQAAVGLRRAVAKYGGRLREEISRACRWSATGGSGLAVCCGGSRLAVRGGQNRAARGPEWLTKSQLGTWGGGREGARARSKTCEVCGCVCPEQPAVVGWLLGWCWCMYQVFVYVLRARGTSRQLEQGGEQLVFF